jgi:hypothetical protein
MRTVIGETVYQRSAVTRRDLGNRTTNRTQFRTYPTLPTATRIADKHNGSFGREDSGSRILSKSSKYVTTMQKDKRKNPVFRKDTTDDRARAKEDRPSVGVAIVRFTCIGVVPLWSLSSEVFCLVGGFGSVNHFLFVIWIVS